MKLFPRLPRAFLSLLLALPLAPFCALEARQTNIPGEPWWKSSVVYQLYPRSFYDSNGDGIGDLNGIRQKLDYLRDLGIDAIWLNPIYPSALVDSGYDVTDFKSIDPQYGTLQQFDRLVAEAHQRNIRVLMDFVPAHTSDQHPWFLESSGSATNSKAGWYVWANGKTGGPPNDWLSFDASTRSAWQLVPSRNQYYYHMFDKRQPELNWRNPDVKAAMLDAMRFWISRGVAGFRLDAINYMYVDDQLRDNEYKHPDDFNEVASGRFTWNLPELHQTLREMRSLVDSGPSPGVLIGETDLHNMPDLEAMYGTHADELNLPMNFNLFWSNFSASTYRRELGAWESQKSGWPLLFFSNHDFPRSYSRLGDGKHNSRIARVLAGMALTSRGTPIIYYGEELGLPNADLEFVRAGMEKSGRIRQPLFDPRAAGRTPMQWNDTAEAGFSTGTPWLPVQPNKASVNVASELADRSSLLNLYRDLIRLRRAHPALNSGSHTMLPLLQGDESKVLCYERNSPATGESIVVVLNLSDSSQVVQLPPSQLPTKPLLQEHASISTQDNKQIITLEEYGMLITPVLHPARTP